MIFRQSRVEWTSLDKPVHGQYLILDKHDIYLKSLQSVRRRVVRNQFSGSDFLSFLLAFYTLVRRNTFASKKVPANISSAKIQSTFEIIHTNITCKILVPFIIKRLFRSLTKLGRYVSSGEIRERAIFGGGPAVVLARGFAVHFYGFAAKTRALMRNSAT